MPKLTDAQMIILSAAANRENGAILPLPKSIKLNAGAAAIVLKSLIKKKLITERPAAAGDETWRLAKNGGRVSLAITAAGGEAVGLEPEESLLPRPEKSSKSPRTKRKASPPSKLKAKTEPQADARSGTKQATLIDLLKRKSGATIEEAIAVTGWQAHSVRGAISGTLKKKLGLHVSAARVNGVHRYRIEA